MNCNLYLFCFDRSLICYYLDYYVTGYLLKIRYISLYVHQEKENFSAIPCFAINFYQVNLRNK